MHLYALINVLYVHVKLQVCTISVYTDMCVCTLYDGAVRSVMGKMVNVNTHTHTHYMYMYTHAPHMGGGATATFI